MILLKFKKIISKNPTYLNVLLHMNSIVVSNGQINLHTMFFYLTDNFYMWSGGYFALYQACYSMILF